jgi:uncharacterized membrane protein YhaH (DUF805 family)
MNFSTSVKTCFSKYATFSGRASRSEYWYFYLFTNLIAFLISFFGSLISSEIASGLVGLISLFFLLPSFAVFVRRLHDIGKSGWNWLLALIPLIGFIILLVFLCQASEENENKWGEKPIE